MKTPDAGCRARTRRNKRGLLEMKPCQSELSSENAIGSDQSSSLAHLLQLFVERLVLRPTSFATSLILGHADRVANGPKNLKLKASSAYRSLFSTPSGCPWSRINPQIPLPLHSRTFSPAAPRIDCRYKPTSFTVTSCHLVLAVCAARISSILRHALTCS